jgi:hypothetical protein
VVCRDPHQDGASFAPLGVTFHSCGSTDMAGRPLLVFLNKPQSPLYGKVICPSVQKCTNIWSILNRQAPFWLPNVIMVVPRESQFVVPLLVSLLPRQIEKKGLLPHAVSPHLPEHLGGRMRTREKRAISPFRG